MEILDTRLQSDEFRDSQRVWPDNAPSVSMDVGLGKRYAYIDIDPYLLTELLTDMGAKEDIIPEATLHFKDEGGLALLGQYLPSTKTMNINMRYQHRPLGTIIHEGKHFADDTRDNLDSNVSRVGHSLGGWALGTAAAFTAIEAVTKVNVLESYRALEPFLISMGAQYGIYAGYRMRPEEKRAFAAGGDPTLNQKYEDLIDIVPKGKLTAPEKASKVKTTRRIMVGFAAAAAAVTSFIQIQNNHETDVYATFDNYLEAPGAGYSEEYPSTTRPDKVPVTIPGDEPEVEHTPMGSSTPTTYIRPKTTTSIPWDQRPTPTTSPRPSVTTPPKEFVYPTDED